VCRKGREAGNLREAPRRGREQTDSCLEEESVFLEAPFNLVEALLIVLEDDSIFLDAHDVVGEENVGCETADDRCTSADEVFLEEDDKFFELDGEALDVDDIFLEHDEVFLDEKIIVLSNHVERQRRKDGYQTDNDK